MERTYYILCSTFLTVEVRSCMRHTTACRQAACLHFSMICEPEQQLHVHVCRLLQERPVQGVMPPRQSFAFPLFTPHAADRA